MAEGARLESVYAVMSCIVGSNPTPSASKSAPNGSVKQTRIGLHNPIIVKSQAASWRHPAKAAERLILKFSRL